jgi:hypothetical protein
MQVIAKKNQLGGTHTKCIVRQLSMAMKKCIVQISNYIASGVQ